MTEIDHLHISDFKSIRDVSINPKSVNVITGRNNTGKTSLLESIDIAFNPSSIERYGDNVQDLINVNSNKAVIEIETTNGNRSVGLKRPSEETSLLIFSATLDEIMETENDDEENRNNTIIPVLQRSVPEISENSKELIGENTLIVEIDGEDYPYLYRGDWYDTVIDDLSDNVIKTFKETLTEEEDLIEDIDITSEELIDTIERYLRYNFKSLTNKGMFLTDSEDISDISFIQDPQLTADSAPKKETEETSIKKVRVRDYLKEWDIMEDIEDFDFDYIVVDDGENQNSIPYSFLGSGIKTLIGVVWQFIGDDDIDDIILMEEPEVHLHPGYIERLVQFIIEMASKEDTQIFISTHNVDFITGFFSNTLDETHKAYLEKEFKLIQMSELVPKQFDYTEAEIQIEEVHNDLRGL